MQRSSLVRNGQIAPVVPAPVQVSAPQVVQPSLPSALPTGQSRDLHSGIVPLRSHHWLVAQTTEPQTAAYQAAVDNVWFENTRHASSILASWNFELWNSRMDRLDYVSDLEDAIARALNVHTLDYALS